MGERTSTTLHDEHQISRPRARGRLICSPGPVLRGREPGRRGRIWRNVMSRLIQPPVARALAVAVLALATLMPHPATAADSNGCKVGWTSTPSKRLSCSFKVNGTPITAFGQATGTGPSSIRVWISPGNNPELALSECSAAGSGYAACSKEFTPLVADPVLPLLPAGQGVIMWCFVEATGNRSGEAFCGSPEPCADLVADVSDGRECVGLQVP